MFIDDDGVVVRTPPGVPCARSVGLHFTPGGVSAQAARVTINIELLMEFPGHNLERRQGPFVNKESFLRCKHGGKERFLRRKHGFIQGKERFLRGKHGFIQGKERFLRGKHGFVQSKARFHRGKHGLFEGKKGFFVTKESFVREKGSVPLPLPEPPNHRDDRL